MAPFVVRIARVRIGVLTTGYPHERDRVAGSFVRAMARSLAARGHTLTVVCARRRDDQPCVDPGVRVVPVAYSPFASSDVFYDRGAPDRLRPGLSAAWLGAALFPPTQLLVARRALAHADALVSHFVLPCALVAALLRGSRPHLAIAHGTDAAWLGRAPHALQRVVLRGATALQCTHEAARARLAPDVRDDPRVVVRPSGFDLAPPLDALERERVRAALDARDRVLVLSVGRLVPVKGHAVLLEAIARLPAASRARTRCVIAGDGPERPALHSLARRLHVPAHFTGAVDAAERDRLLRAADVFVLPSRTLATGATEGAPVALLEAMGAGLAVIASAVGGVSELAGDAALLVPPDAPGALADALVRLAEDPPAAHALAARARARAAPWAWPSVAQSIEAVLRR